MKRRSGDGGRRGVDRIADGHLKSTMACLQQIVVHGEGDENARCFFVAQTAVQRLHQRVKDSERQNSGPLFRSNRHEFADMRTQNLFQKCYVKSCEFGGIPQIGRRRRGSSSSSSVTTCAPGRGTERRADACRGGQGPPTGAQRNGYWRAKGLAARPGAGSHGPNQSLGIASGLLFSFLLFAVSAAAPAAGKPTAEAPTTAAVAFTISPAGGVGLRGRWPFSGRQSIVGP